MHQPRITLRNNFQANLDQQIEESAFMSSPRNSCPGSAVLFRNLFPEEGFHSTIQSPSQTHEPTDSSANGSRSDKSTMTGGSRRNRKLGLRFLPQANSTECRTVIVVVTCNPRHRLTKEIGIRRFSPDGGSAVSAVFQAGLALEIDARAWSNRIRQRQRGNQ
jgi:hypothetical protein